VAATQFKVVLRRDSPRPSFTAWKTWKTGWLRIEGDRAEFVPKNGASVEMEHVTSVAKGWKNQKNGVWLPALVDSWIEVVFGDSENPDVVFLNDPRFLLMASYLPHRKLLAALRNLVNP
jgi:hypothetical protein